MLNVMEKQQVKLVPTVMPEWTRQEVRIRGMMAGYKQAIPDSPGIPEAKTRVLRVRTLLEEVLEFARDSGVIVRLPTSPALALPIVIEPEMAEGKAKAFNLEFEATDDQAQWAEREELRPDLEKMADALSDIDVFLRGSFIACGIRSQPLSELTDENNLMKIANGKTNPETGKFEKAKNHPVPNYTLALALQGYLPSKKKLVGLPPMEGEYMMAQHAGWFDSALAKIDFTAIEMRVLATAAEDPHRFAANMAFSPTGRKPSEPDFQHLSMAKETGRTQCQVPNVANTGKPGPMSNSPLSHEQLKTLPVGDGALHDTLHGEGANPLDDPQVRQAVAGILPGQGGHATGVIGFKTVVEKPPVEQVHRQPGTNMLSRQTMSTQASGFNTTPRQPDEERYEGEQVQLIINYIRRGDLQQAADYLMHNLCKLTDDKIAAEINQRGVLLDSLRLAPPGGPTAILFRYAPKKTE